MHPLRRPLGITNPLSPPPTLGANIRDRPLTVLRSLLSFTPAFGEPRPNPQRPHHWMWPPPVPSDLAPLCSNLLRLPPRSSAMQPRVRPSLNNARR
ncbi:MAG: hypothetical protein AAFY11_13680 [Cyanobacteria bacterium J06641_5]